MGKIKVLMIGSDNRVKGGITSVILQLMNHPWEKENVDMKFLPTFIEGSVLNRLFYFIKSYIKLIILLVIYQPNILHIHMSHNGSFYRKYYIHKLCNLFGTKTIIHLHSSEFKKFYENGKGNRKRKIQSLLKECDRVFVLGDKWNKIIKEMEPRSKTVVLNNTVALPKLTDNSSDEKGIINVLFLGVLVKRKGVIDLLNAVERLNRDGVLEKYNVRFKIGGTGQEEDSLKNFIATHGLSDFVEFLGWVSGENKEKFLSDSQIFTLPSYNEGLPISILEAISSGLPIVSTDVGSVNEAVINDYNGYLVEPGNIDGLKNSLEKIIVDKNLRFKFSKNARRLAEDRFNDKDYYEKITNTYKSLLKKS